MTQVRKKAGRPPNQVTPEAIAAIRRYGIMKLADQVGIDFSAVSRWQKTGIPAQRVEAVSTLLNVPPYVLRPDVFSPPSS